MEHKRTLKCELYNDSMQGWKGYPIQEGFCFLAQPLTKPEE